MKAEAPAGPPITRRTPLPSIRLSKILAQSGLTSRRGAEAVLAAGRVTVNGRPRGDPGAQADPVVDIIAVDGRRLPTPRPRVYVLLHKPKGYLSSRTDPEGRPVVLDLLPGGADRLYPVGRLDGDVEGLLLLTNDGELANRLLHPRYDVPRVYHAEVERRVRPADLARWRKGVVLADGPAVPKAVQILRPGAGTTWLSLTFGEGRNREVKRYCQALGHPVRRLRRVQFGPLKLGGLPVGRSRPLTAGEVEQLKRLRRMEGSPILRGIR